MKTGKSRFTRLREFVTGDVWDVEISSLPRLRRAGISALRVVHLVVRGFQRDECPLHASALTFNTLMSIVPVLALSLALAKGFAAGETLQEDIKSFIHAQLEQLQLQSAADILSLSDPADSSDPSDPADPSGLSDHAEPHAATNVAATVDGASDAHEDIVMMIDDVVEQVFFYVEKINFTALGGVGLGLLVWSVVSVLGRVEYSFNRVWGVTQPRSLVRKFTDYLGVVLLTPVLILMSSSLPALDLAYGFLPDPVAGVVQGMLETRLLKHLTVLAMVSLSFGLFIMIMPSAPVRFVPAFCGGVVAALLFIGWLWVCVHLEIGLAKQGRIYGSFAIVPIILLWILISWQIVLFGAESAFAIQNCATYRMEQTASRASAESKIMLALHVISQSMNAMRQGSGMFNVSAYAREHAVPVRLLNEVMQDLGQAGLVVEVAEGEGNFVMMRSPEDVRVKDVVTAMMRAGVGPKHFGLHKLHASLHETLGEIERSAENLIQPPAPAQAATASDA